MNLNSVLITLEIARLGTGYIVRPSVVHRPANGGTTTTYSGELQESYFKDSNALAAWLANISDIALRL